MYGILFLVTRGNAHVITLANSRERAKRNARDWLGDDPDHYTVEPLTRDGDRIHLDITLQI